MKREKNNKWNNYLLLSLKQSNLFIINTIQNNFLKITKIFFFSLSPYFIILEKCMIFIIFIDFYSSSRKTKTKKKSEKNLNFKLILLNFLLHLSSFVFFLLSIFSTYEQDLFHSTFIVDIWSLLRKICLLHQN